MRGTLIPVRCKRLLSSPLDSTIQRPPATFEDQRQPKVRRVRFVFSARRDNAGHHPRPNSTCMRGSVEGRRVHAVVGRGLDLLMTH
jgi:hypothetical protein